MKYDNEYAKSSYKRQSVCPRVIYGNRLKIVQLTVGKSGFTNATETALISNSFKNAKDV